MSDSTATPAAPAHQPRCVLVTGGAGFIGANFLLRMAPRCPGVTWVNLDALTYAGCLLSLEPIQGLPNYHFVRADIADAEAVRAVFAAHPITTVVHFAAESHVDRSILDPLAFVRTNVVGTATLLEAARAAWTAGGGFAGRRFHHISTDEVFGSLGPEGAFSETTPYDPRSPYSASKAASDHLVRAYHHTYGLPTVLSNCTNNYGPHQFPEKLIPLCIANAAAGREIPVYGRGANIRDWLYVEDHCEAIERVLRYGADGETYAIGGQCERTNLELVHLLLDLVDEALGRPPHTSRALIRYVADRPGHDFRYAMDIGRIRETLGWAPAHTLEEGLAKTVAWHLGNPAWLAAVQDQSYRSYYETQYGRRLTDAGR